MGEKHDDEAQENDAEGMGEGGGEPHDDGVLDVPVLSYKVGSHEGFPVPRGEGVPDPKQEGHDEPDKQPGGRKVPRNEGLQVEKMLSQGAL